MLSTLRTALIIEVEGLPPGDSDAEASAKTTREAFLTDTRPNPSDPKEVLTHLADMHDYLENHVATEHHEWLTREELRARRASTFDAQ